VAGRWELACDRVLRATERAGRSAGDVTILLATKTIPIGPVREALAAGASVIGENRVQELVAKAPGLADAVHETHLIGPLQRNKARAAVSYAQCIQTVADRRLAERLASVAESALAVMIQVNTSGEATKSGCRPEEAVDLAGAVCGLANLTVKGFMTIGLNSTNATAVGRSFAVLREVRDLAVASGCTAARELSMGMSGDLEIAIAEGATMVRLGSAVFGQRITM
jgi:pyridoxal phosphate enzyme (YggS family)